MKFIIVLGGLAGLFTAILIVMAIVLLCMMHDIFGFGGARLRLNGTHCLPGDPTYAWWDE